MTMDAMRTTWSIEYYAEATAQAMQKARLP
jgi:hypothetical protein